ncbi:helix-turn-helix transcriptional regulator [Shinella sumterensis]|uniref:helix-turn-helix transcriptional regulator n=1 Tax=Shinella sumterensis TaxID=1967501 RepID=UPI003F84946B
MSKQPDKSPPKDAATLASSWLNLLAGRNCARRLRKKSLRTRKGCPFPFDPCQRASRELSTPDHCRWRSSSKARTSHRRNTENFPTPPQRSLQSSSIVPTYTAQDIHTSADLGRLVKKARKEKGLTQQEFADSTGVGRRFVSALENGKPTVQFGKALKVALGAGISLQGRRR